MLHQDSPGQLTELAQGALVCCRRSVDAMSGAVAMHVQCATCKEATAGEQAIHSSGAAAWLKGCHADCSTAQLSAGSVVLCTYI